jgi:hypothetical protein
MLLNPRQIPTREKTILAGLYLSKYDGVGLKKLGFESFTEAFNVLGYALGSKPASIKNYRDEFDPYFPNRRKGWHKRTFRQYCRSVFEEYKDLDFETFTVLVKSLAGSDENTLSQINAKGEESDGESPFAKRLITGIAAEQYFESMQPKLPEFRGYELVNTTQLGCGYDFRLSNKKAEDFFAVEVKGIREKTGSISLTPKEHDAAKTLSSRFFLFVVKNFQESPFHQIFHNPLFGNLRFARKERVLVQVSWMATL